MADIETVVTHLQIIKTWALFARKRDLQFFTAKHLEDIAQWADDALELLKEQEAVKVQYTAMGGLRYGACPKCDARIDNLVNPKACGFCGQELKWE